MGGRGGRVIKVTNLNSRGPGSFAAACYAKGPRIVVFEVGGVIEGNVNIQHPNITIAGQTAPRPGITLRGSIRSNRKLNDVVIRFLRVRPGRTDDAIQLPGIDNLILDHITASWGSDETIDLYRSTHVTVQWCTIEESVWDPNTNHNTGLIFGEHATHVSVHHNLFAHHHSRNPLIKNGPADVINNVVYDFRDGFTQYEGWPATGGFNLIGNYYKAGPSDPNIFPFNFTSKGEYYLRDNYIHGLGMIQDPWAEAHKHLGLLYYAHRGTKLDTPIQGPPINTHSPYEAYEQVLARAGCFPRDVVTKRTIREVHEGKGSWGRQEPPDLLEGLESDPSLQDTDGDGMPDIWEVANKLMIEVQDDVMPQASGYTAIEDYINACAKRLLRVSTPPVQPWSATSQTTPQSNPRIQVQGSYASLASYATDKDLAQLAQQPQIETLNLHATRITDAGMTHLASLTGLRVLNLSGTQITDAGLTHLRKLPSLRALNLAGTQISAEGLEPLKSLKGLMLLDLPAGIPTEAVKNLERAIPDIRITVED
jgi:pectate lyase